MTVKASKRFAAEEIDFRSVYTQYARSRISASGALSRAILAKQIRKSERLKRWMERHGLEPFFCLQFGHLSNQLPRMIVAKYEMDYSSHFGQVLHINRAMYIQVEGSARVFLPGFYKVVFRLKLAPDYEDIGPLNFLTKVIYADPGEHLLSEREKKLKYSWAEDEVIAPLRADGTHIHFIWNPPNPAPIVDPAQNPLAAMHVNDRPFGAPDPLQQREDDGFGIDALRNIQELNNRIRQRQMQEEAQGRGPILPNPNFQQAGNDDPAPIPFEDELMPALEPIGDGAPPGPRVDSSAAFPVDEYFDLLSGFIHVPQAGDRVCFAITNFTNGFKYGIYIDYAALVPITKAEYDLRHSFPTGPMLLDGPDYWDTLYETAVYNSRQR